MPLGDSITYGAGDPGGYRDPLAAYDLVADGIAFHFGEALQVPIRHTWIS